MIIRIFYSGEYEDNFTIEGETLKGIGEKVDKKIDKMGWEREKCWSETIEE